MKIYFHKHSKSKKYKRAFIQHALSPSSLPAINVFSSFFTDKLLKKNVYIRVSILMFVCSFLYSALLKSMQPGVQMFQPTGIALTKGPSDLLVAKSNRNASVFISPVLSVTQMLVFHLLLWFLLLTLCHVHVSQRSALGPLCSFCILSFSEDLKRPYVSSTTTIHIQMTLYVYFQPGPLLWILYP